MSLEELTEKGYTLIKISDPYLCFYLKEQFYEALKQFKEVDKNHSKEFLQSPSINKYGLIHFASSLHHPFFRLLRTLCYSKIVSIFEGSVYKFMQCYFTPISCKYFYRSVEYFSGELEDKFYGWFNLSTEKQIFPCIPYSHTIYKINKEASQEYVEMSMKNIEVPVGYAVIYNSALFRRHHYKGLERFYLSFSLSRGILYTSPEIIKIINKQDAVMQNENYGSKEKKEEWKKNLIKHPLLTTKNNPSLFDLNLMYKPYSSEEMSMMRPLLL